MITRDDILSMEYLKKTEFTGSNCGMRYRLERAKVKESDAEDAGTKDVLRCTVWPEPFNFFTTPADRKISADFFFGEDGIVDAVAWMNDRLFEGKDCYDHAPGNWDSYQ